MDDLSFVLLTGKQEMRAEEPTKRVLLTRTYNIRMLPLAFTRAARVMSSTTTRNHDPKIAHCRRLQRLPAVRITPEAFRPPLTLPLWLYNPSVEIGKYPWHQSTITVFF